MFENKVLRRLFRPNMKEVTREWKSLHDEELNDLYSSHKSLRSIKTRWIRWEGHEAGVGEGDIYIYKRI